MNKSNTSSLQAQEQRMTFKQRSAQVKTEVIRGTGLSPWEADVLVELLEQQYFSDPQLKPLQDGQVRLTCVAAQEGPGMSLAQCRKVRLPDPGSEFVTFFGNWFGTLLKT